MNRMSKLLDRLRDVVANDVSAQRLVTELEKEISDLPKKVLLRAADDLSGMKHGSYNKASKLLRAQATRFKEHDYE